MSLDLKPFDEADYLHSPRWIAGYLFEAIKVREPALIWHAIKVACRALWRLAR